MISDNDIKNLYKKAESFLAQHATGNSPLPTQFHRGIGLHSWKDQHVGGCERHLQIFSEHKVIPRYCFECFKVYIEPRNVIELFKLMVVFEQISLPNDNTRKCIVETRHYVNGAYKGFVYCRGLEEGNKVMQLIKERVSTQISEHIPISLKHGCTEYTMEYPEFSVINDNSAMPYNEEWINIETSFDKEKNYYNPLTDRDSHNRPGFTLNDALIMYAWLSYAATIEDPSYLKIADHPIEPFQNIQRPKYK